MDISLINIYAKVNPWSVWVSWPINSLDKAIDVVVSGDLGVTVCGLAMLGGVVGFTSRGGCWQKYSITGKTYRIKIFLDDVLKSSMLRNEVFFGIRTMNNHMFMSIFNYLELTKWVIGSTIPNTCKIDQCLFEFTT